MIPPKKSLLPNWRVFGRRRPVYTPLDGNSGLNAIEIPQFSRSVFLTLGLIFENSTDLAQISIPSQTSSSPICIDSSNADLNKALPKPPSRIHVARHSLVSLYYHRLRKLEGYHFGVLWCAGVAALVLIINLILTIWAVAESGVQGGLGTLQDGSCKRTTSLTFWIHLAINVLSTLLLGASNYSMQCLSSPTRSEIDKAHSQGIWLDIGVPSVRNLRRLSTPRIVLWWLLAISSIPLHLLYNSAVFSTLSTQEFDAFLVTSEFVDGASFNVPAVFPSTAKDNTLQTFDDTLQAKLQAKLQASLQDYKTNRSFVKLESKECVDTYSAQIVSTNSDLIMVSDYPDPSNSLVWYFRGAMSSLIDGSIIFCDLVLCGNGDGAVIDPQNLVLQTSKINGIVQHNVSDMNGTTSGLSSIDYCLSKRVSEHCKLQFSLTIMIVVIVCNTIKAVCMTIILWEQELEPLVTLGDAIASFLDRPDVTTKRNCIAGRTRFEHSRYWGLLVSRWDPKGSHWFRAASLRRWSACNVL